MHHSGGSSFEATQFSFICARPFCVAEDLNAHVCFTCMHSCLACCRNIAFARHVACFGSSAREGGSRLKGPPVRPTLIRYRLPDFLRRGQQECKVRNLGSAFPRDSPPTAIRESVFMGGTSPPNMAVSDVRSPGGDGGWGGAPTANPVLKFIPFASSAPSSTSQPHLCAMLTWFMGRQGGDQVLCITVEV